MPDVTPDTNLTPPTTGDPEITVNQLPRIQTVFLGILVAIAMLAVCYVASTIILPIILAVMLKLFLQPLMKFFGKIRLPQFVAASLSVGALVVVFFGLGVGLSGPASEWATRLPAGIQKIQDQVTALSMPFNAMRKALNKAEITAVDSGTKTLTVAMQGTSLADRVIRGTTLVISGLMETILVLFFLLISGDTFLRRLVEMMPTFSNKKQVVEISQQVECDIAAYLGTITLMNLLVGVSSGLIMAACGVDDPILWGTIAFLLNYVPILGPALTAGLFAFAGIVSLPAASALVFVPVGLYLLVHMIEGQFVTPMLLARRFTLNPVLVVLSLVFWYWMWGVPGAILATPMLAILKIVCDRVEILKPFGHFMAGSSGPTPTSTV